MSRHRKRGRANPQPLPKVYQPGVHMVPLIKRPVTGELTDEQRANIRAALAMETLSDEEIYAT